VLTNFDEAFRSDQVDPIDGIGAHEFPFDEIAARLDHDVDGVENQDREAMAAALLATVNSLVERSPGIPEKDLALIGRKAVALAWILHPEVSQRKLAIIFNLPGVESLSRCVRVLTRRFSLTNRCSQVHRKGYRSAHPRHTTTSTGDSGQSSVRRDPL
jgi:hypothetical protein